MADEQTINIPQLVLVLVLGGLAVRWFLFSPSTGAQRASRNGPRAREEDVNHIQEMFPQLDRRTIMWNLQRNGGSRADTTERMLSGRGLEAPPASFQPPMPATAIPSSSTTSSRPSTSTKFEPDLITRYNLASKLATSSGAEGEATTAAPATKAWSNDKNERQALMQKRREEMILAARRKMEAKLAAEKEKAQA